MCIIREQVCGGVRLHGEAGCRRACAHQFHWYLPPSLPPSLPRFLCLSVSLSLCLSLSLSLPLPLPLSPSLLLPPPHTRARPRVRSFQFLSLTFSRRCAINALGEMVFSWMFDGDYPLLEPMQGAQPALSLSLSLSLSVCACVCARACVCVPAPQSDQSVDFSHSQTPAAEKKPAHICRRCTHSRGTLRLAAALRCNNPPCILTYTYIYTLTYMHS